MFYCRCLFVLVVVLTHTTPHFSQICNFSNCDARIIPRFERTFKWEATGAIFDNLASAEQGVCAVEIDFAHNFLSDLVIFLTSPAGQTVQLVRDDLPNDTTSRTHWKIKFTPCEQASAPDFGFKDNFDDNTWPNGATFSGTYYPATGCLEDFNMGSINGQWELKVSSKGYASMGYLYGFKIDFWQNEGIYCDGLFALPTANKARNTALLPDLNSFLGNTLSDTYSDDSDVPLRERVANNGKSFVGIRYKYAGKSPETGFDCSGFTSYVFNNFWVMVSPASVEQSKLGRAVALDQVFPGDLIFFSEDKKKISHVALVVKRDSEGVFCVHSTSSKGVIVENITKSTYWNPKIQFARDMLSRY